MTTIVEFYSAQQVFTENGRVDTGFKALGVARVVFEKDAKIEFSYLTDIKEATSLFDDEGEDFYVLHPNQSEQISTELGIKHGCFRLEPLLPLLAGEIGLAFIAPKKFALWNGESLGDSYEVFRSLCNVITRKFVYVPLNNIGKVRGPFFTCYPKKVIG